MIALIFISGRACQSHINKADVETLPQRQALAEKWVLESRITAVVRCRPKYELCDVVPQDSRSPFAIACDEKRCDLWLP